MVDTCYYTSVQALECKTPRMNSNMNYGLWVIIMRQCRFTDKRTPLVGDADNGGGCVCVGTGVYEKSLSFLFNFAATSKNSLLKGKIIIM